MAPAGSVAAVQQVWRLGVGAAGEGGGDSQGQGSGRLPRRGAFRHPAAVATALVRALLIGTQSTFNGYMFSVCSACDDEGGE